MAAPTTKTETGTAELEAQVWAAIHAGLGRLAQWRSFQASAAAYNVPLSRVLSAELVAQNEQADRDFYTLARAVVALDSGAGELVRWRVGNGPIKVGVKKAGAQLGWVAAAGRVIVFAVGAAISYGAFYLLDLFGGSVKVTADAERLRASNAASCQATAAQLLAAGHATEAATLAAECAKAEAAAARPAPGLWEEVKASVATVAATAAGLGGAALMIFAVYALSRSRPASRDSGAAPAPARKWQSPVQFHRPVSFRRPYA